MDFPTPVKTPFSWADPLTYPLTTAALPSNPPQTASITSNKDIQDFIVRKHDYLRANTPASNMRKMTWNGEAQNKAQAWADTCPYYHGTAAQRQISSRCRTIDMWSHD